MMDRELTPRQGAQLVLAGLLLVACLLAAIIHHRVDSGPASRPGTCFGADDGSRAVWVTDPRDVQVYRVSSWKEVLPSVCGE